MITTYETGYRTGSGNKMPIRMHGIYMKRDEIPFNDNPGKRCVTERIDCGGFNGGCPPYAPRFSKVKPSIDNVYVLCLEYDMAGAITHSGWRRGRSTPGFFILKYADRMTMHYIERALKFYESLNYYTLGASNCPGCRPKDCTVTRGGKCTKPRKRRFSVESTGVECNTLHDQLFGEVLPWWFHTKENMPVSLYRYALVYTDKSQDVMDNFLMIFMAGDKSYCAILDVQDYSKDYDEEVLIIPEGKADAGREYPTYVVPIEEMIG